ncbi:anticodon-binding domain-containing protein [Dipodascopsis tothii]|uniref:anticodon-binding domain-containing protein n=1 Tax=Dipodascopsis tothii TaxID=44089 RepID=UPI0034CE5025
MRWLANGWWLMESAPRMAAAGSGCGRPTAVRDWEWLGARAGSASMQGTDAIGRTVGGRWPIGERERSAANGHPDQAIPVQARHSPRPSGSSAALWNSLLTISTMYRRNQHQQNLKPASPAGGPAGGQYGAHQAGQGGHPAGHGGHQAGHQAGHQPGHQTGHHGNHLPTNLEWLLGVQVKVTTILDDVVVGTVYAYCTITDTLTLMKDVPGNSKELKNFRVLKIAFIRSIVATKPASAAGTPPLPVSGEDAGDKKGPYSRAYPFVVPVQLSTVAHKENAAVRAASQQAASKGAGVSADAQSLFDALTRTLPCKWVGQTIVVMGDIRIDPPYTLDSCHGPANALARVKKVLEGERRRLNLGDDRKGG